jgi:Family of unknown function (DUF5906)
MIQLDDFYALAPAHRCIYRPTKDAWLNDAVDMRLPRQALLDANGNPLRNDKGKIIMVSASQWLAKHRSVERATWHPGEPEIIRDKLAVDTGWIEKPGAVSINLYLPPNDIPGDAAQATPWVEHWHRLYPDEADHLIGWLAHRKQCPGLKPNHCVVLVGDPDIGKDTLLYPVRHAVGAWNFRDISLGHLVYPNNDFLCAVIVRVNEARDTGDTNRGRIDRYALHDHMKPLLTTPPETHRINRKYLPEYTIFNLVGVIITTNHPDALYLPSDDRRHFVAASECKRSDFSADYFDKMYTWYDKEGGIGHVAAYLREYDLTSFNAKMAPSKTAAFWDMVNVERSADYGELADAIDALGKPEALTLNELIAVAPGAEWLSDRKMARTILYRLRRCEYVRVPNPAAERNSGLWLINKKRMMIYARKELPPRKRLDAAIRLQKEGPKKQPKFTIVGAEGE